MNRAYLFITALFVLIFMSCQSAKKNNVERLNEVELEAEKQLVFPLDEQTYYLSKSMFQFEENGKESLHFENTRKSLYSIVIFDIENRQIAKQIPLHKTGPNGLPAVFGSRPSPGAQYILVAQNNISRISSINDKGEVIRNYNFQTPESQFTSLHLGSYYNTPGFVKDSCLFLKIGIPKPDMKREDWPKTHMFASLDLRTGKVKWVPIFYPPIFKEEYENIDGGYGFSYDYNYKENRLICGFFGYDSLMVTDDLKHIRWYNAKSRYLKSMKPKLGNAMAGINSIIEFCETPKYWHIMYDKYRDVYYRFAEMPYKLAPNESPYDEPKGKEFSVIVLNADFEIIGETKFPGKKYFYKMSFVGREGLYISENNLENPQFDENKLVFTCFKIKKAP